MGKEWEIIIIKLIENEWKYVSKTTDLYVLAPLAYSWKKNFHKLSIFSSILEDGIIQNEILLQCMLHT